MNIVRCYIIDDLPIQFKAIKHYIQETDGLELVGTESSSLIFLEKHENGTIVADVLFLDIDMPGLSGIELAAIVNGKYKIVFTTAHREFGPEAFELGAVDYLLKPIRKDRFDQAIEKVKSAIVLDHIRQNTPDHIYLTDQGKGTWRKLIYDDIICISSDSTCKDFFLTTGMFSHYITFESIERDFPADIFIRVHKSHIINVNHIVKGTSKYIKMSNGEKIPIGRKYIRAVKQRIV